MLAPGVPAPISGDWRHAISSSSERGRARRSPTVIEGRARKSGCERQFGKIYVDGSLRSASLLSRSFGSVHSDAFGTNCLRQTYAAIANARTEIDIRSEAWPVNGPESEPAAIDAALGHPHCGREPANGRSTETNPPDTAHHKGLFRRCATAPQRGSHGRGILDKASSQQIEIRRRRMARGTDIFIDG